MSFLWVIFSYLLGSLPFGYLISRFSGKDILKIGWRKTSGSNVFKNVGKWQGALTGILDVLKGYLAVFGAQQLEFSLEIQILAGVAAVTGHNWSLFLKFAGGRGIGTFIGAFFALSPQILGFSLIPFILLALIWNAAISTILFLATAIFFSIYPPPFLVGGQFQITGLFTSLSLLPIFIKRLSPINEIIKAQNRTTLFRNRLIFDNDQALLDLRIKKIIQRKWWPEDSNPGQVTKVAKSITAPLLIPPKMGWKAAKFGAKIAKKPIGPVYNGVKKLILKTPEKVVKEIKADDLKKMMIAAAKKIVFYQEEINKINVWPVADKDTGYNLAATLLGIEVTISRKNYPNLRELTKDIKEAAMVNARGNAGLIYTGYLIEFLDRIKHLASVDALHLSLAMKRGIKAARLSIAEPVEGTILDVIKAAGDKTYEAARRKEENIIKILEEAQKVTEVALKETKEKLEVLKENDVVDAGALGFVKILEAWIEDLKGLTPIPKPEVTSPISQPDLKEKLKYRYEVVLSFRKTPKDPAPRLGAGPTGQVKEINVENLKREISPLGESLDIIELEDKIKFHIHTNQPGVITDKFKNLPEAEFQVEDMEGEEREIKRKPLGLVVDQVASLPREFLERYDIEEVSFTSRFPDGEIITSKEEIYPKMKEALRTGRPLPTTSAPSFKEFFSVYQRAFKKFEKILVITISAKLSGTYSSARIARSIFKKPEKLNIFVFDSFSGEIAEGLVVVRAQELISQGKKMEEVVEELKEFCPKVSLLAFVNDFRYLVQGGRLKLPKLLVKPISLIQNLGIRPLIVLKDGKLKIDGVRFGKDMAELLAKETEKQRKGKKIRTAVAHADNLKTAKKLKEELEKKEINVLFISSVSPAIGTHAGPGALIVAFHSVDS